MLKVSNVIPRKYIRYIPDNLFIRISYFQWKHKLLHTRNPRTFSEKMQWIKLYGHLEDYGKYADKFAVREFVKETVGADYLVPLVGHWDNFDAIPFDTLPKRFVLKATHGSGYNFICKDKAAIDKHALRIQVDGWLGENFYKLFRESQYKHLKPTLVCEKYLEDESGELKDYKFCCFNGKPEFLEVHSGRSGEHVVEILDTNWNRLPYQSMTKDAVGTSQKPKRFAEMLEVAEKLAQAFPFVRVDLYCVNGKIYFGELTFTPLEGFPYLGYADAEVGELLDLETMRRNAGYKNSTLVGAAVLALIGILHKCMGPFTS